MELSALISTICRRDGLIYRFGFDEDWTVVKLESPCDANHFLITIRKIDSTKEIYFKLSLLDYTEIKGNFDIQLTEQFNLSLLLMEFFSMANPDVFLDGDIFDPHRIMMCENLQDIFELPAAEQREQFLRIRS